jgi:hypothetical protein
MGINFPTSPAIGTLHPDPAQAGLPQYRWDGSVWVTNTPQDALGYVQRGGDTMSGALTLPGDPTVALHAVSKQYVDLRDNVRDARRNRIVNGAMQVSQENGNNALTVTGWYPADQWVMAVSTTGAFTYQRVASVTPNGSANRVRLVVNTADTSIAAGEFCVLFQNIEGSNVADFRWGSASARQVILRFGWRSPAGTYSVAMRNGVPNRTYLANFTVAAGQANTDTEQVLIIPGDITGTWAVDTTKGTDVLFNIMGGTSVQGVPGWQAGNFHCTAAQSNGFATAGNTFELFDVGLYLDADNTGVAPKWEMPDPVAELALCQRYYQKHTGLYMWSGYSATSMGVIVGYLLPTSMRAAPTAAFSSITYGNCSGLRLYAISLTQFVAVADNTAAGPCSANFTVDLTARM